MISPNEFQELKNELGILWSSWVNELEENKEVEIWLNQLELALVDAEKRQHPISKSIDRFDVFKLRLFSFRRKA